MRKRLVAAGAALLLLVVGALVLASVLRGRAEEAWRASLAQLEKSLGPGSEVRYESLDLDLIGRGGSVRGLSVAAPGLQHPFSLEVGRIEAEGLEREGAEGFRFDAGSAQEVTLVTRRGRWQADSLALEEAAVEDSPVASPRAWTRRLGFRSGTLEALRFDGSTALPAEPPAAETAAGGDDAAEGEAVTGPVAPPPLAGLAGSLARAELEGLRDGRLARLRFERLTLAEDGGRDGAEDGTQDGTEIGGQDQAVAIEAARGGLEDLDLTLLASGLAGRLVPTRALVRRLRLEGVEARERDSRLRVASLESEQLPEGERLLNTLTLEGLTGSPEDPELGALWRAIEEAGYGTGFRFRAELLASPHGERVEVRSLLLELPNAASLELGGELVGFNPEALEADPGLVERTLGEARLVSARLELVDRGGLDAVLAGPAAEQGMTAKQLRQVAAFQVAEALRQGQVPRELGLAVQEFLEGPGRLEIRVRPAEPIPLLALAMLALAPEQAAQELGLSASSAPLD